MEYRKLEDLELLEGNPRIIRDENFRRLCRSIKDNPDYFEARPVILSNRTGKLVIIAGNQRFKAAKYLGLKEVPTFLLDNLTEERERQIIIKDNVEEGEWDYEILANEWDLNDLEDWGVSIPGVEPPDEAAVAEEDDFIMPDTIETDIKVGDLIQIGPHRLICGSSTEKEIWEKLMGDERADLVITDPPYNVDYEGGTGMKIMNDKMDDNSFFNFLLDAFTLGQEYTKAGGGWYVWHADSEGLNFRAAFEKSGLMVKQCLIWVKSSLVMGRQDYQWKHEPCLYGWKPGAAHYFTPDRKQTTVIDPEVDFNSMKKTELVKLLEEVNREAIATTILRAEKPSKNDLHPTMKPIMLLAPLLRNSSRKGDIIVDGFGGSGSTMVAAHQMSRVARLIELDPAYVQVTIDRMQKLDPDLEITIHKK